MISQSDCAAFHFWQNNHNAPFHFPVNEDNWYMSMYEDVDSEGRQLFDNLVVRYSRIAPDQSDSFNGMIVYGNTAFGFDQTGEISSKVHHNVIRDISFSPNSPKTGQTLLDQAMTDFDPNERVYAYFHYFGMSACARHGKLHESQAHIHRLLIENGFQVEHENVYYSKMLTCSNPDSEITLFWKNESSGSCREFTAVLDDQEVCWGQIHFLPQGDIAYLRWIYTDEKRQHQGIGTKVMYLLFAKLYNMGIRRFDTDTALSNLAAQNYYKKCGFTNEGITRSYYIR